MKAFMTLAVAALLPLSVQAERYQVLDNVQSKLNFQYSQMGVVMEGKFEQFTGEIDFDPKAPASGRAVVEVPLSSIDTGTDEGNQEVQTGTWLNVAGHPLARFETQSIQALGGGRFAAQGVLSLKGQSRQMTVPVTFIQRDGFGIFEGAFTLTRSDFSIGEGAWAAPDVVAANIGVSFTLVAKPAP